MQVALDVSPLRTGHSAQHSVRGTGFYITHLLSALRSEFPTDTFIEYSQGEDIPSGTDVVHIPYFEPFFLTLPSRYILPTVVTVHDLTPLRFPTLFPSGVKGRVKWLVQKRRLKKASGIITDSMSSKKDIRSLIGVSQDKIEVAYLAAGEEFNGDGVTKEERERLEKKYNLPPVFVLYVGDVTPNKNLPVLVKAVKQAEIPVVMVGKALDTKEFDRSNPWNKDLLYIREHAASDPLFHILGFVPTDDLQILYKMASIFVFPSFYEGFGLPLIEAMSSGTPVLTTKESSIPEVGGSAVLYTDRDDPRGFSEMMKKVLEDKVLAKKLSEDGLRQSERFSWKKTATQTMDMYRKVGGV